jgi:hypothetical protein
LQYNVVMMSKFAPQIISLLLFLTPWLGGCNLPATPLPPTPSAQADLPSPPPTLTPVPTLPAPPTKTPPPPLFRPYYVIRATIHYASHTVEVDQFILYPNQSAAPLEQLVLAVEPNLWPNCFTLQSLSVDDTPISAYELQGQRLELPLPTPLAPNGISKIHLTYTLSLPAAEQEDPSIARPRIFGYTQKQINLTNWYPFIVPQVNGEWVLHDPWAYGEHLVYELADFEVNLKFSDSTPPIVAASGTAEANGEFTRYTLTAGRTFAISASYDFQVATRQVGEVTVSSYYSSLYPQAGLAALDATAQALSIFSQQYGPYPHKSLAVVMADFNDGMEYSAFFYLSRDFYNLYNPTGSPVQYLLFVAAHETAHQWWFEQVANDQSLQPWLDEALATYSERIYYENLAANLLPEWWAYRVDFYQPKGFIDIPVAQGQGFRPYTNAVYLRGAHFLEDLRQRIGDEIFFAFLRDYLNQFNGKIATAADFFTVLRQHTHADLSDLISQYFQNPY